MGTTNYIWVCTYYYWGYKKQYLFVYYLLLVENWNYDHRTLILEEKRTCIRSGNLWCDWVLALAPEIFQIADRHFTQKIYIFMQSHLLQKTTSAYNTMLPLFTVLCLQQKQNERMTKMNAGWMLDTQSGPFGWLVYGTNRPSTHFINNNEKH